MPRGYTSYPTLKDGRGVAARLGHSPNEWGGGRLQRYKNLPIKVNYTKNMSGIWYLTCHHVKFSPQNLVVHEIMLCLLQLLQCYS